MKFYYIFYIRIINLTFNNLKFSLLLTYLYKILSLRIGSANPYVLILRYHAGHYPALLIWHPIFKEIIFLIELNHLLIEFHGLLI